MTAFDYLASRDDADALIAEFGQVVFLRRTTAGGTGWDPTQTTTDYQTVAAILDYRGASRVRGDGQKGGDSVLVTQRDALIAAGPLTALGITSIGPPDSLVAGVLVGGAWVASGAIMTIVRVLPTAPAGTVVMYDCLVQV